MIYSCFLAGSGKQEQKNGVLRYKKNAPDLHLIFGYLQIGKMYADISRMPKEVLHHPHAQQRYEIKRIIVFTEHLIR